jgi:hypothetical protein
VLTDLRLGREMLSHKSGMDPAIPEYDPATWHSPSPAPPRSGGSGGGVLVSRGISSLTTPAPHSSGNKFVGEPGIQVSRPFPSWNWSILTDIYLCHACSDHEILRVETARQVIVAQQLFNTLFYIFSSVILMNLLIAVSST